MARHEGIIASGFEGPVEYSNVLSIVFCKFSDMIISGIPVTVAMKHRLMVWKTCISKQMDGEDVSINKRYTT